MAVFICVSVNVFIHRCKSVLSFYKTRAKSQSKKLITHGRLIKYVIVHENKASNYIIFSTSINSNNLQNFQKLPHHSDGDGKADQQLRRDLPR